jgi:hypothetical protein
MGISSDDIMVLLPEPRLREQDPPFIGEFGILIEVAFCSF